MIRLILFWRKVRPIFISCLISTTTIETVLVSNFSTTIDRLLTSDELKTRVILIQENLNAIYKKRAELAEASRDKVTSFYEAELELIKPDTVWITYNDSTVQK